MTDCYECAICLAINHVKRLHCSKCGTIPARYSLLNRPARPFGDINYFIPVDRAFGAQSIERWHFVRLNLRTVTADYYASE